MLNRKKRALRSQTTGLGRIGRVLLSVAVAASSFVAIAAINSPAAHAAGAGLNFYWKNESGSTTTITRTAFTSGTCATATSNINYAWSTGSPSNCNVDGFTSYATGYISAFNGASSVTKYFCSQSDDGFYLVINGTTVIDNWAEQGAKTGTACNATGNFTFAANTVYTIQAWHHENAGGADMRLLWSEDNASFVIVPAANLGTSSDLLKPSISISSVLPNYSYGNNTYSYGTGIIGGNCGAGQNTSCSYSVSGGTTSYTYSISAGTLPGNLSLNTSSGALEYNSGGTFSSGTFSGITIRVTDANSMYADSNQFQITVTKQAITITSSNQSRNFGDSNPNLNGYSITSGSLQYSDSITVTGSTSATAGSAVGSYTITPTATYSTLSTQCSSTLSNCYSITAATGTLTVNQRPITIKPSPVSKVFGNANPALTSYSITSGSVYSTDTFTISATTSATTSSNVGTYPITITGETFTIGSLSNYLFTLQSDSLTVTTRALTVKSNSLSKTYGAVLPNLNGFTLSSGSLYSTDTFTITGSTAATQSSNVGTYAITPSAATFSTGSISNYSLTYQADTLTIVPISLTIKPNPVTKTYGNPNPSLSGFSITTGSLYSSDTFTVSETTTATSTSNVGTYLISISGETFTSGLITNYSFTLQTDSLTVSAIPITVKANSVSKLFGDVVPNLNGFTLTSGSMYSTDTFTVTGISSASQSSGVGTYAITQALNSFSSGLSSNYSITFVADTLTVNTRPITIKAKTLSRNYGDVNPNLNGYTITSGSTYSTDTFTVTGSTTATQGSSVGIYPISQTLNSFSSGSSSNYTLTFVGDTLTVGARPATVKANSVSRKYGAANPSLTGFTISSGSIYSTDTFTVNGSTTATTSSNIGTYPITQSLNTFTTGSASNYNLTFQADTLTVGQADTLTITASTLADVTYKLSASGVIPSFSTSGLVGGDTLTISTSTGYFYQGYASPTCAQGGYCNLGDVGPAGGIVFYDFGAGSGESSSTPVSTGGRYLEAAPAGSGGYPTGVSTTAVWCSGSTGAFSNNNIVGLGAGAYATNVVVHGTNHCTGGAAYLADGYSANTYSDWFLPTINEGQYMLNYWSQIGMQSGVNYWTSSNWSGDTNQSWYLTPPTWNGNLTEARTISERWWPIRAFDPTNTTPTLTGTPIKTLPTLTGTYQITIDSTTPTFTAGSASNYVAISYAAGSVKIVKTNYKFLSANESVTVMTYPYGTSLQLVAASDAGDTTTATFSVTNGANSTCTTSSVTTNSLILSATATGTNNAICLVTLTRAATTNFNAITGATTTITFIRFTPVAAVPYFSGGGNVAVGIGDPTTYVASDTASVISAIYDNTTSSSSVFHAGDSITLTGTYLDGVTQIKFIGGGTTVTFSANSSPTTLTFTLPGDVVSGPVLVQKPALDGRGYKSGRFNITIT